MRIRRLGFLVPLCAMLAAPAWGADDQEAGRPAEASSVEALKPGERCRVQLFPVTNGRAETVTTYEGIVTRMDAQGIALSVEAVKRVDVRKGLISRVPYLGKRLGRNIGIGGPGPGAKADVWPAKATIRSMNRLGDRAQNPADPRIDAPGSDAGADSARASN